MENPLQPNLDRIIQILSANNSELQLKLAATQSQLEQVIVYSQNLEKEKNELEEKCQKCKEQECCKVEEQE